MSLAASIYQHQTINPQLRTFVWAPSWVLQTWDVMKMYENVLLRISSRDGAIWINGSMGSIYGSRCHSDPLWKRCRWSTTMTRFDDQNPNGFQRKETPGKWPVLLWSLLKCRRIHNGLKMGESPNETRALFESFETRVFGSGPVGTSSGCKWLAKIKPDFVVKQCEKKCARRLTDAPQFLWDKGQSKLFHYLMKTDCLQVANSWMVKLTSHNR